MTGTHSGTESAAGRPRIAVGRLDAWLAITSLGVVAAAVAAGGIGASGIDIPAAWGAVAANLAFWAGVAAVAGLDVALRRLGVPADPPRRSAEPPALAAVVAALVLLVLQLGRPRLVYWLLPLPNQMDTQPHLRSPLLWLGWTLVALGVSIALAPRLDRRAASIGARGRAPRALDGAVGLLAAAVLVALAATLDTSRAAGWGFALLLPRVSAVALLAAAALAAALAPLASAPLESRQQRDEIVAASGRRLLFAATVAAALLLLDGIAALATGTVGGSATAWLLLVAAVLVPQLLRLGGARASAATTAALGAATAVAAGCGQALLLVGSLDRGLLPATWSSWRPAAWDMAVTLAGLGIFLSLAVLRIRDTAPAAGAAASADERVSPVAGA